MLRMQHTRANLPVRAVSESSQKRTNALSQSKMREISPDKKHGTLWVGICMEDAGSSCQGGGKYEMYAWENDVYARIASPKWSPTATRGSSWKTSKAFSSSKSLSRCLLGDNHCWPVLTSSVGDNPSRSVSTRAARRVSLITFMQNLSMRGILLPGEINRSTCL